MANSINTPPISPTTSAKNLQKSDEMQALDATISYQLVSTEEPKKHILASLIAYLTGSAALAGFGVAGVNVAAITKWAAILTIVAGTTPAAQVALIVLGLVIGILGIYITIKMGIMAYRYLNKPKEVSIRDEKGIFLILNNGMQGFIRNSEGNFYGESDNKQYKFKFKFNSNSKHFLPLNKDIDILIKISQLLSSEETYSETIKATGIISEMNHGCCRYKFNELPSSVPNTTKNTL